MEFPLKKVSAATPRQPHLCCVPPGNLSSPPSAAPEPARPPAKPSRLPLPDFLREGSEIPSPFPPPSCGRNSRRPDGTSLRPPLPRSRPPGACNDPGVFPPEAERPPPYPVSAPPAAHPGASPPGSAVFLPKGAASAAAGALPPNRKKPLQSHPSSHIPCLSDTKDYADKKRLRTQKPALQAINCTAGRVSLFRSGCFPEQEAPEQFFLGIPEAVG